MCATVARSRVRAKDSYECDKELKGIAVETLDFVLRKARIAYERVPLYMDAYGGLRENSTWSGYLGAIQQVKRSLSTFGASKQKHRVLSTQ